LAATSKVCSRRFAAAFVASASLAAASPVILPVAFLRLAFLFPAHLLRFRKFSQPDG
jgi:hypothetical protein